MKTNKIKVIKKNNMSFVEIDSIKGQALNRTAVESISKNQIPGLIPLACKMHGSSFKITYNITGYISLSEYLKMYQMNRQSFGFLLKNIFNVLETIQSNYYSYAGLLLTFGKIKIDPSSKRMFFIYVPIQYYDNGIPLKDFLLKIIDSASFVQNEDLGYVQEYIRILNTGVNFSLFDLGQYIKSLTGEDVEKMRMKDCPECGARVPYDANTCPNCRASFSRTSSTGKTGQTSTSDVTYNPLIEQDIKPVTNEIIYNQEPQKKPVESTTIDPDDTTVLGDTSVDAKPIDEDPPTTLLDQPKVLVKEGFLIRIGNNEKRLINAPVFTIGKNIKNNFSVPDNSAVSRNHAAILHKDDRFYLTDKNSLNKTYIDGKVIAPLMDIEIFSGTKIRFANEDFLFKIETKEV